MSESRIYREWMDAANELLETKKGVAIGILVRWEDENTEPLDVKVKFHSVLDKRLLLDSLRQIVTMLEKDPGEEVDHE